MPADILGGQSLAIEARNRNAPAQVYSELASATLNAGLCRKGVTIGQGRVSVASATPGATTAGCKANLTAGLMQQQPSPRKKPSIRRIAMRANAQINYGR